MKPSPNIPMRVGRLILGLICIAFVIYTRGFGTPEKEAARRPEPTTSAPAPQSTIEKPPTTEPKSTPPSERLETSERPTASAPKLRTQIERQTIRDEDGRVAYEGTIDLSATLDRIQRDETLSQFRNDGSVFQNRERRLPKHETGYYREWVHRTPGLSGPGPQRVISGREGEFFYTPNHYRSFVPLHQ